MDRENGRSGGGERRVGGSRGVGACGAKKMDTIEPRRSRQKGRGPGETRKSVGIKTEKGGRRSVVMIMTCAHN